MRRSLLGLVFGCVPFFSAHAQAPSPPCPPTVLGTPQFNANTFCMNNLNVGTINGAAPTVAGGLFNQIFSATPSQTNTGLSTLVNVGTGVVSNDATGITIADPSPPGTENLEAICKTAPASPFTVKALIGISGNTQEFVHAGIAARVSGSGKMQVVAVRMTASLQMQVAVINYTNATTFASFQSPSSTSNFVTSLNPTWVAFTYNGTTITYATSVGGGTFYTVASDTPSSGFLGAAPNQVCFYNNPIAANPMQGSLLSYVD